MRTPRNYRYCRRACRCICVRRIQIDVAALFSFSSQFENRSELGAIAHELINCYRDGRADKRNEDRESERSGPLEKERVVRARIENTIQILLEI